jgi:hypothetical protein
VGNVCEETSALTSSSSVGGGENLLCENITHESQ